MNSTYKKERILTSFTNLDLMFRNSRSFSSTSYIPHFDKSTNSKRWGINNSPILRHPSTIKK